jgi:hypothetical protein
MPRVHRIRYVEHHTFIELPPVMSDADSEFVRENHGFDVGYRLVGRSRRSLVL